MILGDSPTRLGIFFFFDADGVADRYVEVLLKDLLHSLSELVIVANGHLTTKSHARLTLLEATIRELIALPEEELAAMRRATLERLRKLTAVGRASYKDGGPGDEIVDGSPHLVPGWLWG